MINPFSVRRRPACGRNGGRRFAFHGVVGALLVFLTTGFASMHSHGAAEAEETPFAISMRAGGKDVSGPFRGHAPDGVIDCRICEFSRRGDAEEGIPCADFAMDLDLERPIGCERSLPLEPPSPTRGRPSPRGPPLVG